MGPAQRFVLKHLSRNLLMPDAGSSSPKEMQDLLTLQRKRRVLFKKTEYSETLGPLSWGSLLLPFQLATCISFPLKHQLEV